MFNLELSSISQQYKIVLIFKDFIILMGALGVSTFLLNLTNLVEKYLKIKEYEVNVKIPILEKDFTLLETIISECFNEYILLNGYSEIEYINEETENKINKEIGSIVMNNISPLILTKLSLLYNINNLSDIIAQKIYLLTTAFVVQKNKVKTE